MYLCIACVRFARSIIIILFIFIVFCQAPLFNELIYRFLVNNNRRARGRRRRRRRRGIWRRWVASYAGWRKKRPIDFRRPPLPRRATAAPVVRLLCRLCLPCASLLPPRPRSAVATAITTTNLHASFSLFFPHNHRRRHRVYSHRRCATETR